MQLVSVITISSRNYHRYPSYTSNLTDFRKAEIKQFRDSLLFSDLKAREDDIAETCDGTCEWIFQTSSSDDTFSKGSHKVLSECSSSGIRRRKDSSSLSPNFVDWLEHGECIFWVNGKAGSSKSTLMKHIIAHPMTKEWLGIWTGDSELLMPYFFFWKHGANHLLGSVRGMM